MRKFQPLILAYLFAPVFLIAQSFYTINVGTFLDAKSSQFDDIRNVGFVYSLQMEGNLTQVYLGGYDNRSEADKALQGLKQKGYNSSFVEERRMDQGQIVTVIQLATRNIRKGIEWEKMEAVGDLFGSISGENIKIMTGIFPSVADAQTVLPRIRQAGFTDAFIKNINNTLLIRIGQFETGLKKALIPFEMDEQVAKGGVAATTDAKGAGKVKMPDDYYIPQERITAKSPEVTSYSEPEEPQPNIQRTGKNEVPIPDIRAKVKRRSVLDLQRVLKSLNDYTGSLDGYYGPGTATAYEKAVSQNRELQKYSLLADYLDPAGKASAANTLQYAVNNLLDDPKAPESIERSQSAIAKGYQAYLLFRTLGPSNEVNNLMNQAIHQAFQGKKLANQPAFDYNATYAYQDLDQLILHLHYIHAAPGNDIAAPCWLYEEHPKETAKAHAAFAGDKSGSLKLQACDQFLDWPEIRTLQALATDMNGSTKIDQARLSADASKRANLFVAPKALTAEEAKAAEDWHTHLWEGLNAWADKDPINRNLVLAMKIVYYQSEVRLEDFFMDRGFTADQSKSLAMATLKTMVGYHLERFV
ncbi:MAG: SPOR domain-containing protein [Lewinellaceae bacterium]|nr:SPOR domain-containing protein [Lewinella sp.]MCB9277290.1 SPOR domain-containing protein [Lewinellaceae bacterium]